MNVNLRSMNEKYNLKNKNIIQTCHFYMVISIGWNCSFTVP